MSSSTTTQTSPLPQARLVRTTHNKDGLSVFASDSSLPSFSPFGPQGSSFTVFDVRASVPVTNTDVVPSFADSLPRCPPGGANFCITDIKAGGRAPLHRTQSLDYCVVLSGEIVLRLDSGEETTVRAGEFIVQQGVNHLWINQSDSTCRILCVMLGAQKIELDDGRVLEETVFRK